MPQTLLDKPRTGTSGATSPKHEELTLERRHDGLLIAGLGSRRCVVHVRRCFPWSDPRRFISLRDDDDEEFVLVADLGQLSDAAREVLETSLAEAGFIFEIATVLDLDEEIELRHWRVITGQGERRFQTRLDDWPRTLPDGSVLVRDITGDLYRIADPAGLDKHSRALLWAFVDD